MPNLVQGHAAAKPAQLPSGWEYARLLSPQTHRRNVPGTFKSSSAKRLRFETNDDYKERAKLA